MNKILLVESNSNVTFFISQYFSTLGYIVDTVDSGEKAIKIFNKGYNLILIDNNLSKMSGYSVLNYIRQEDTLIPIIFLSDQTSEVHEIQSYERGANYFHKKPINYKILHSQIKSLIRDNPSEKFTYGCIHIEKEQGALCINDTNIKLSSKELRFALLLLKNQNKTFTKEELFEIIFDETGKYSKSRIDTFLCRFNSKIGKRFFESYYGMGIRFNSKSFY